MKKALLVFLLICLLTSHHACTPILTAPEDAFREHLLNHGSVQSEVENYHKDQTIENLSITVHPILFDIDFDGLPELLIPLNDTIVAYRYNSTAAALSEIWKTKIGVSRNLTYKPKLKNWVESDRIILSPVCADFDGDGEIEVAVVCSRNVAFLRGIDGSIKRIIPIGIEALNVTVADIDLDGAIDVVIKTKKSAEPIAFVNMLRNPPELGKMYEAGIPGYTTQIVPVAESLGSQNIISMLVYVLTDRLVTAYKKGGILYKTQLTFAGEKILLQPLYGNFTGRSKSVSELLLFFSNRISLVVLPNRTIPLNITTTDILPVIKSVVNVSSISFSQLVSLPLVADFDNDSKEDLLLWFNASVGSDVGLRTDAIVLVRNITYGTAANISMLAKNLTLAKNVLVKKILAANVNNRSCAIALLSNGTLLLIGTNTTDMETTIFVQKITDISNTTSYLLLGDIDGDGNSELIYASNVTLEVLNLSHILNSNVTGLWAYIYGSVCNLNKMISKFDSDVDGLPDESDPAPYDSDLDNDMDCDYTELVLGLNVTDSDTDDDLMGDGFELIYGFDPKRNDSNMNNELDGLEDPDSDGLRNYEEWTYKTNPSKNDTDGDKIIDFDEVNGTLGFQTSPISYDTDNDGLPDKWEIDNGFNPLDPSDALLDDDDDGLTLFGEYIYKTNYTNKDTDRDLMYDGYEVYYGLNPLDSSDASADDDNDGLINIREFALGTDPTKNDTDSDKMPDGWEWRYGLNPLDPSDNSTDLDDDGLINVFEYGNKTNPRKPDTDDDGMPDLWEIIHKLDPNDPADAYRDNDFDYLINKLEYVYSTNPLDPDSDNDGLPDGLEILIGTNPLDPDSDCDGLPDGLELALGTDPLKSDTDGDGLSDKEEVELGTDPLSPERSFAIPYSVIAAVFIVIMLISLIFFKQPKVTVRLES